MHIVTHTSVQPPHPLLSPWRLLEQYDLTIRRGAFFQLSAMFSTHASLLPPSSFFICYILHTRPLLISPLLVLQLLVEHGVRNEPPNCT